LVGLTQVYLQKRLSVVQDSQGRGIVLEIKQEPGLGETANIILLNGRLSIGDQVVVAKRKGAISTRLKAIFMPKPLDEMRDPRDKFASVDSITAAAGAKIVTPDLDGVLAGSPIVSADETNVDATKASVESEVKQVIMDSEKNGIVLKADTLGSLEAIAEMLRRRDIPIRNADIGPVTRRDVVEASAVKKHDRFHGVVLAFNVRALPDADVESQERSVRIFQDPIIYNLIDSYSNWILTEKDLEQRTGLQAITPLCKFRFLRGMVFRRNDPAVFGVEILEGRLRQKASVMNSEGKSVGNIHQLQEEGKTIQEASKGKQIAVSIVGPTIGRQINEGDTFYTLLADGEVKILNEKYLSVLTGDDSSLLKEIIQVRRKNVPLYGY
ncbi:MAG TPA: translation initiation factor IF-2, partial [Nitrososphaerales archaeon]|nr:translation initiation factor IF-2 [Nitrososphaerales archaeon]